MQNISQNIKLSRKAKGWTQQQMADELFVSRQTVSNWETGKAMPDLAMLENIAVKLETDVTTLLYGEKSLKGYAERKIANIIKYWVIAMLFFLIAETQSFTVLDRISDYAGYIVVTEYPVLSHAIIFYSFIFFFVWILVWRGSGLAEQHSKTAVRVIVRFSLLFSFVTISVTAFSAMRHCLYTYERYEHIVRLGSERYEIADIDYIAGLYNYHDSGWCGGSENKIIYIDSATENEADSYINDVVSKQPLKIERIAEEKAADIMFKYHIEKAPAVMVIRYENADVMEGMEEISLLEEKIHNYKQHNIFFY